MIVKDNRELRNQLIEAQQEIAELKERLETVSGELDSREAQLEVEKTKVIRLENVREINSQLMQEQDKLKLERD